MRITSPFLKPIIFFALALMVATGCGVKGSSQEEEDSLLDFIKSAVLFGGSDPVKINIVNARKNKSTVSVPNPTQYVYIQPNIAFLTGPDKKPVKAGQTKCLDTDYAKFATTDPDGNTIYSFTTKIARGIRVYVSIGTGIPDEQGTENGDGQTNSHSSTDDNMKNIRFDWIELTLDGSPTACANLTSLEQLGICMSLAAQQGANPPTASLGWNKSFNTIAGLYPSAVEKNLSDTTVRIKGASSSPADWPAANLNNALKNKTIRLTGNYNGVTDKPDTQTNPPDSVPAAFIFTGVFDSTGENITLTGNFWNVPNRKNPSTAIIHPATMTINGLTPSAIFAAKASLCTITHGTGANDGGYDYDQAALENNRWAKLFGNLVAGINTGLWDAEANNLRWSSGKAFQDTSTCNPYSKMIKESSNSYGDPYSDLTQNVQLILGGSNVNTMVVTLLDDGETGGYTVSTPTSSMQNIDISLPSTNVIKLESIEFEQGALSLKTVPVAASDAGITIGFPVEVEFGTPVKLIFHYSDYSESVLPYATLTLPENVFTPPGAVTIPSNWLVQGASRTAMFAWGSINYLGPYINLILSADVISANFSPVAPLGSYHVTYPASFPSYYDTTVSKTVIATLTSISFGGTVMHPYQSWIYFPETVTMDSYNTLNLTYTLKEGTTTVGTRVCPVQVWIPADIDTGSPTEKPIIITNWNAPLTADEIGQWNGSGSDWHIDLTGNAYPLNFTTP